MAIEPRALGVALSTRWTAACALAEQIVATVGAASVEADVGVAAA
ncbi:MAG: hypothetical protein WBQ18_11885 [Solirubrobacteraceae bacterium]